MANLAFSQKDKNAKSTYFIEKDWRGFLQEGIFKIEQYFEYAELHKKQFGRYWDGFTLEIQYQLDNNFPDGLSPKLHTIRRGNRWKAGNKIEFVLDTYDDDGNLIDRFQFAPVFQVKSVQKIIILNNGCVFGTANGNFHTVYINGKMIVSEKVLELALNDGFNFVEQFFEWFSEDFEGQIVHWTNLKY